MDAGMANLPTNFECSPAALQHGPQPSSVWACNPEIKYPVWFTTPSLARKYRCILCILCNLGAKVWIYGREDEGMSDDWVEEWLDGWMDGCLNGMLDG
eukprot:365219-Chlamydomonas_euryale.AAC.56